MVAAWALALLPLCHAATLHDGFSEEVVFSGLSEPTALRFAPDGRVFVAEKGGAVKVFDGLADPTPTTLLDIGQAVFNGWDRGLLGLAIDPDFPAQPYVYLLYTYDRDLTDPGSPFPRWADTCPSPPGFTGDGCAVNARISRFQVSPSNTTIGGETILVEGRWCQQYPSHSIGDLVFDAVDRVLYASAGDGASFNFVDWGQGGGSPGSPTPENVCEDPPVGRGEDQEPPTAEGGALRSQDLRSSGDPVSYDGTVIRIDPDTGAPAPGNPLIGGDPEDDAIVAFGLRNPFRMTTRPGTHEVWIGDVGWSSWEEINRIADGGDGSVENFGWPCYEGAGRQSGYDAQNLDLCENLYTDSLSPAVAPYYTYPHGEFVDPDPAPFRCTKLNSSSTAGLQFYSGAAAYPSSYQDALFFSDYSRDCIFVMFQGPGGLPDPATRSTFVDGASNPVDLQLGPDGMLYYVDITGQVIRILYSISNSPPVAVAEARPSAGAIPLSVDIDASASYDPDPGDTLSFSWDLDNDGMFGDRTDPLVSGLISTLGVFPVTVRVSDDLGEVAEATAWITAGNEPPQPEIFSPPPSLEWTVGDSILVRGRASDPEESNLDPSRLDWEVILHHCPGLECHSHPVETASGVDQILVTAPDHEWYSYLEVILTATDNGFVGQSGGEVAAEARLELVPSTSELTYLTDPPGLDLIVSGQRRTTPFTLTTVVGSLNSVSPVNPQIYAGAAHFFDSWSDGGAESHVVIGPTGDTNLTATFREQEGESIQFSDFTGASGIRLNGDAQIFGSVLRLTETQQDQVGSAFLEQMLEIDHDAYLFTQFTFEMSGNGGGADGMAFLIQSGAVGALGGLGGGLGYSGIQPSLIVELDPYANEQDPDANHVGINLNGNTLSVVSASPGFSLDNGVPHGVWIEYDGARQILDVFLSEDPALRPTSPILSYPIDLETQLGSDVWVGFSAATGGQSLNHDVLDWSLQVFDACVADDFTCDGIDDDCDDSVDDDYVPQAISCGLGVCSTSGTATCVAGQLVEDCTPGAGQGPDDNCNAVDEDCDGTADEHFSSPLFPCGSGICAVTGGQDYCLDGQLLSSCDSTPSVSILLQVEPGVIDWSVAPLAQYYQVVRGDLGGLRSAAGDYSVAPMTCLGGAEQGQSMVDAAAPAAGQGWWYLIRAANCSGSSGYESEGVGQAGERSAGIDGNPLSCPLDPI